MVKKKKKKNLPCYIPLIKTTVFEEEREIPPAKKSRPMIGLFLPLFPSLSTTPAYILGSWEEKHLSRYIHDISPSNKVETGEVPSKKTHHAF